MTGESTMDTTPYCAVNDVKDRLLVKNADTSYDAAITIAIIEASRTVDIFLKPYETVPLQYTVPDPVIIITADLSASIFKRRLIPSEVKIRGPLQPDMINDVDGTGWFAMALKKLLDYIKNYYALAVTPDTDDKVYNPEVFKELFAKGILTLKEARAYMANATEAIQNILNEVYTRTATLHDTKVLVKSETNVTSDATVETLTSTKHLDTSAVSNKIEVESMTKLNTKREYVTKKQRGFGFVSGKDVSDNAQAGYKKDGEAS